MEIIDEPLKSKAMKVIIEISNQTIDLASSIIMNHADTEEKKRQIKDAIGKMKASKEPALFKFDTAKLPISPLALFAVYHEVDKK